MHSAISDGHVRVRVSM